MFINWKRNNSKAKNKLVVVLYKEILDEASYGLRMNPGLMMNPGSRMNPGL